MCGVGGGELSIESCRGARHGDIQMGREATLKLFVISIIIRIRAH